MRSMFVAAVLMLSGCAHSAPNASSSPALEVIVDGQKTAPWTCEAMRTLASTKDHEYGVTREVWSLRDAAKLWVSPRARVVALAGANQERLILDKTLWDDPRRTPAMRLNRRGQIVFQWSDAGPILSGKAELRDVRVVEIVVER